MIAISSHEVSRPHLHAIAPWEYQVAILVTLHNFFIVIVIPIVLFIFIVIVSHRLVELPIVIMSHISIITH